MTIEVRIMVQIKMYSYFRSFLFFPGCITYYVTNKCLRKASESSEGGSCLGSKTIYPLQKV